MSISRGFLEAVSGLILNDSNSSKHDGVVSVTDSFKISHLFDPVNMSSWVKSRELRHLQLFFGFTEAARFGNSYLMADDTGLYVLGGDTDNGTSIVSVLTTAGMDFGSTGLKQVPSVLLGTDGTDFILQVSVDGKVTARYEINYLPSNLETKQIKIGKGLIGYNWQFKLITDNDFNLDSFEFYPIVFKRKHNG